MQKYILQYSLLDMEPEKQPEPPKPETELVADGETLFVIHATQRVGWTFFGLGLLISPFLLVNGMFVLALYSVVAASVCFSLVIISVAIRNLSNIQLNTRPQNPDQDPIK